MMLKLRLSRAFRGSAHIPINLVHKCVMPRNNVLKIQNVCLSESLNLIFTSDYYHEQIFIDKH